MSWLSRYVGIPFKSQGRDFSGVDCWGLVWLIYKHELGIDLPEYGDISATDLAEVAKNITEGYAIEPWVDINRPSEFDVVVMHFYGTRRVGHVGIVTGSNMLLHTERSFDSVSVPQNHMTVRHRIVGYRRHRSRI